MPAIASANVEQFQQLGWCENVQASGETTNSCRPAADAAPASMRAPQACSFSPLTNNNTSHSRASSMHLTQWLDQASAVGSFLSELPGQLTKRYNFEPARRAPYHWAVVSLRGRVNGNHRPTGRRERPCGSRGPEHRDELAALHTITSSARASSVCGTSRPSALAVVRLITRSNLVGCSTGRSAGFAPRRILST